MDDEERLARAGMACLSEPDSSGFLHYLASRSEPAEALPAIRKGMLPPGQDPYSIPPQVLERWRQQADITRFPGARDLERFRSQGIRLVCPGDPEWPQQLDELGAASPLALWTRGPQDLRDGSSRSLAIAGPETAFPVAPLAEAAANHGWTVITGAAYGPEADALRAAIDAGGGTIGVIAHSIGDEEGSPARDDGLIAAVAEAGVLVSERPPGTGPNWNHLRARKRIVAALSRAALFIDGDEETVSWARDLDRPLMAVPGAAGAGAAADTRITDLLDEAGSRPAGRHPVVPDAVTARTRSLAEAARRSPLERVRVDDLYQRGDQVRWAGSEHHPGGPLTGSVDHAGYAVNTGMPFVRIWWARPERPAASYGPDQWHMVVNMDRPAARRRIPAAAAYYRSAGSAYPPGGPPIRHRW